MATSTTSTEAELIKEYWKESFLKELRSNLTFFNLGLVSNHPKNNGTTVHWLSLADLSAAAALTEGTDPTEYTLSAGDITAGITQYGAVVKTSDLLEGTSMSSFMTELNERIARNAKKTIDNVGIRDAILSAGGLVQYAGTAVARNSIADLSYFDFDLSQVRDAKNTLTRSNALPLRGNNFVCVHHPDATYDLQADSEWQALSQQNDPGFQKLAVPGKVGSVYGVDFIETSDAYFSADLGSASSDIYQAYVFGKEAFGVSKFMDTQMITKSPSPVSTLDLYSTVGWKTGFATKALQTSALVRIEHTSSRVSRR